VSTDRPGDERHLREELVSSEELLKGQFLVARRDTVSLPDGSLAQREYVCHPGAVVVVAELADGRFVLERQWRYPLGKAFTEFPAGKLDPGEDPWRCAQRELREETGYTARRWAYAGPVHLAIAYSTEVIHLFFARDLHAGERRLDPGEFLDVFPASLQEMLDWVRSGQVTDAKTLFCLLWAQNLRSGVWSLNWQDAAA
jgi:ADP-ribose pyrophosphatase